MKLAEAPGWVWQVHARCEPPRSGARAVQWQVLHPLQRDVPPLFGQEIISKYQEARGLVENICLNLGICAENMWHRFVD